jgi:hypothetical protein
MRLPFSTRGAVLEIGRGLLYIERTIAVSPCAMPRTVRLDARVVLVRFGNRPSLTLAFGYAQFLLRSSAK